MARYDNRPNRNTWYNYRNPKNPYVDRDMRPGLMNVITEQVARVGDGTIPRQNNFGKYFNNRNVGASGSPTAHK